MPRMTPSEAFVETMHAHGVTDIFGIMGSAFLDAMDIFEPAGVRFIPVVHEQGAAHMADGFSRVSGRQGVCIGQNGPGISNCVTAIAAAFWAHSPVVIVTPETGTMGIGLGGFQECNQLPMFREFTKYQAHLNNPARMAELTGRCFDRALSEMGPTQLNIPRDLFYGDIDVEIPQPSHLDRGPGGEKTLNEAADLLGQAEFPVIVSGGGVVNADAVEDCRMLAERLGSPVVNSYLHNDSFPASHPLWCGPLGYQGSKAAMKLGPVNTNWPDYVTFQVWNLPKLNTNALRRICHYSAETSGFLTAKCSTPSCMSPNRDASGAGCRPGLETGTPSTPE